MWSQICGNVAYRTQKNKNKNKSFNNLWHSGDKTITQSGFLRPHFQCCVILDVVLGLFMYFLKSLFDLCVQVSIFHSVVM